MGRRGFLFLLCLSACSASGFPYDPDAEEGVHGGVDVEWWYHFGWLTDEDGGEWTCFSSFFRTRYKGAGGFRYLIHDLTDLKTGKGEYRGKVGGEVLAAAALEGRTRQVPDHDFIQGRVMEKDGDPLKLVYGADTLDRTGLRAYRLKVGDVTLELRAVSEPLRVEGTGLTGVERPEDMHYYTIPRLEATGTVRGRKAKGVLWYDHQWGKSWVGPSLGWSWWGLQLEDGTNVNAVVIRDLRTGEPRKATLTHDTRVYELHAVPVEFWTSESKVRYPVVWELAGGPLRLRVEPLFKDRERPVADDQESIWEGPVRITGTHRGRGYQELVGYARERPK